ncbi:Retrovirus-related Pol polyprotein from transposon 17.6, partial [Mucuna pruriens]
MSQMQLTNSGSIPSTVSARRSEIDEDLLKLFRKVEINIPFLDTIKQVPTYAKFLKELCVHKRKKKGAIETRGVASALVKHENTNVQRILPKKCQNPSIFAVACTIDSYTLTDSILDLEASINIMPTFIYRSLNLGDLEPTGMVIQLINRSVMQPLGVLKDVLVQVNELIFLVDFYVPDMEDEPSGEGSALILGRPFFLMARTKIEVHVGTLSMEFEDTFLLEVLRRHKKAIGWTLPDLSRINPSICMHKILLEKDARPVRQQQCIVNPTLLDIIKNEVTKLLVVGIIYPILDSQWDEGHQELTRRDGVGQDLEQLANVHRLQEAELSNSQGPLSTTICQPSKSHFFFLDGFFGYMQTHITPMIQHKTTFTCPFGTFAYTRMSFELYNAPSIFQRCMISIFFDLLEDCMDIFMDNFTVYAKSLEAYLDNLSKVLRRCIDSNLVLNFEKCHFMVTKGIILGHLISIRGIEVDKAKIDIIYSLPNLASVLEVRSFLVHVDFSKIALPLSKLLQKDADFVFDHPYAETFQELERRLTSTPILQAQN